MADPRSPADDALPRTSNEQRDRTGSFSVDRPATGSDAASGAALDNAPRLSHDGDATSSVQSPTMNQASLAAGAGAGASESELMKHVNGVLSSEVSSALAS